MSAYNARSNLKSIKSIFATKKKKKPLPFNSKKEDNNLSEYLDIKKSVKKYSFNTKVSSL